MSQSIDIVRKSLEYYDRNNEKYEKILSKIKYYQFILRSSDLDHSTIIFFDKNKQKLFESRYEYIGLYNKSSSTWIWAWSIPTLQKNGTYISKKILNYALNIPSSSTTKFIRSELITSRFRIASKVQLNIHASVASYISKTPLVFKIKIHDNLFTKPEYGKKTELFEVLDEKKEEQYVLIYYLFLLDHQNVQL